MDTNDNISLCKKAMKTQRVLDLLNNTPDGVVIDADTILADLSKEADYQESGIAAELIAIWTKSSDRKSVEQMFLLLLDVSFEEYLDMCIEKTTR